MKSLQLGYLGFLLELKVLKQSSVILKEKKESSDENFTILVVSKEHLAIESLTLASFSRINNEYGNTNFTVETFNVQLHNQLESNHQKKQHLQSTFSSRKISCARAM